MSSHDIKNPNGGVPMGHVIEQPDPNDHLYERIFSLSNVKSAWKRVKSNKGAAGVDGVSIEAFPGLFRDQWGNIRESLLNGTYKAVVYIEFRYQGRNGLSIALFKKHISVMAFWRKRNFLNLLI